MIKANITKNILHILKYFIILSALGNGLTLFSIPVEYWSLKIVLTNCFLSIIIGYPTMIGINMIQISLDKKYPWLDNPMKRLLIQIVSMLLFAGVVMTTGVLLWMSVSEGVNFTVFNHVVIKSLAIGLAFLILSLLVGKTVLFFRKWKEAVLQQEELKRAHLTLQLQSLKDQVKPHFLFNSFSSLITLINTDPAKATEFVHKLSDVYRYLLEQRENELVPLEEELKFMEDYVFLQKIRFGDKLTISTSIKPSEKLMILPLSLQMMVENAIKHNEISQMHPLNISVFSGDDNYIIIKNNLNKKISEEQSLGLGLDNIRKRIAFFTGKPLLTEENNDNFIVGIPLLSL